MLAIDTGKASQFGKHKNVASTLIDQVHMLKSN